VPEILLGGSHAASRGKIAFDEPILETRFAVEDALKRVEEHEMISRLKFAIERNSIVPVWRSATPLNKLPAILRHAIHSDGRVLPAGHVVLQPSSSASLRIGGQDALMFLLTPVRECNERIAQLKLRNADGI
jgi:hypothetical protein